MHQLCEELSRRGHEITVFSMDPGIPDAGYRTVPVRRCRGGGAARWKDVLRFAFDVARMEFRQFELVHAHGDSQWLKAPVPVLRTFYGSCLDEALRARRLRTRGLFGFLYLMEIVAALRADFCVGISESSCRRLAFRRMQVVPPGIDTSAFTPGARKSPAPSVLFVGHRLRDRKRADLLLDVFERVVLRRIPGAVLHLVCEDRVPEREWLRQHRDLSGPDLVELYRQAWVFCMPSVYEGFGRPYVEAMACGTAVVATENPGSREVVGKSGEWGVMASEGDLGERIAMLLTDAAERGRLERAGPVRARERYSLTSAAEAYERIYERLVAKRREAPASSTVEVERT